MSPVQLTLSSGTDGMIVLLRRIPTQTASRHSASLLVHELVFCGLQITLSATLHGEFFQSRWDQAPCEHTARPHSSGSLICAKHIRAKVVTL